MQGSSNVWSVLIHLLGQDFQPTCFPTQLSFLFLFLFMTVRTSLWSEALPVHSCSPYSLFFTDNFPNKSLIHLVPSWYLLPSQFQLVLQASRNNPQPDKTHPAKEQQPAETRQVGNCVASVSVTDFQEYATSDVSEPPHPASWYP